MKTDIVLTNFDSFKQIIIDTKFYQEILSKHKKLNSGHLYQIHAYVNNSDFDGEVIGILLYASQGEDMDYHYKIGGHGILIKTLDLNQEWGEIDRRLREIVNII